MRLHDEEATTRLDRVHRRPHEQDTAVQAAASAVEAGRLHGHEPKAAVVRLQRLAGNSGVGALMGEDRDEEQSPVLDVVGKGGGTPLPAGIRSEMEGHLGADFGDVRIHDGGAAAESAQAVQAKAYTVGDDVVFGRGSYDPASAEGRHTLAHELTHVVQQRSGPVDATPAGGGIAVSHPDDRFEQEAEASAAAVQRRADTGPAQSESVTTATVQRQDVPEEEEEGLQTMALQRQTDEAPEEEEETTEMT